MIFRRPDAFIIKHIKLFHAIVFLCLAYLLFKTSNISTFYQNVATTKSIIGTSNIPELFSIYMFLCIATSIIITVVIMLLLIKKEKKFTFYLVSLIIFISVLVFYIMSYSNILKMQKLDVAATTYLAYGDFAKIIFYILSVWVFIFLFKATGFDFKTFSIGKNVFGVDFTEADSEEVEINFEIDSNEIKTKRNRQIRELKYLYFENRFKIILVLTVFIIALGIFTYKTIENNKEIYYSFDREFTALNYNIKFDNVYMTSYDYKGNKLTSNGVYLILMFKIKKNIESDVGFNPSNVSIVINDTQYYIDDKHWEDFLDFGNAYKEQKLTNEYVDYFLVYEIPYEFSAKEIIVLVPSGFNYKSNKYSYYKIKTAYQEISDKPTNREYYIGEEMNIDSYGVKDNIKISSVDIQTKYKIVVPKKINDQDYDVVEYIVPTASDNEEKAIMKIIFEEKENNINFDTLLTRYGKIYYQKNGENMEGSFYSFINPTLHKETNTYYIQVSKQVLSGQNRSIRIKIRDQIYTYKID